MFLAYIVENIIKKTRRLKLVEVVQLLREITEPDNESGDYITEAGKTGILINGVEILNYKADDTIYGYR